MLFEKITHHVTFTFYQYYYLKEYFTHKNIYFINGIHLNFDNNNRYRTFRVRTEYYVFNNH